ncbi:MAG: FAD-dependent monooxygenase [Alphaproteobacteria bacterium]|nr:FAD-dependent monooxygenase [Alphaproteobacteria bacterium]MBP7759350.1 FAD-dependent monooxygenase [Alphaproteobacteria bacterium]MBP7762563.1 FAD-dependent monooxygenase [Alphaproteobacteria bacterium]MBP7904310.1 FAD-dependent monooxygenase [Alphaproteobacteria bacterium]
MDPRAKILIAGAGPAGLAAALIFSLRGFSPRVIERQRRDEISAPRRGLILRPRTLEMLEETGVTEALIDAGVQITRLRIEEGERALAQFDLSKLKHRYAFLLSLSEEDVMKVLSARLTEFSLSIEYGLAVRNVRLENGKALVSLSDGRTEEYDCLIGADGVQSTVRTALGIPFTGFDYPDGWSFQDIPADEPEEPAVLDLLAEGQMRLRVPCGPGRIRVVANTPLEGFTPLPVTVRRAKEVQRPGVALTGNAAAAHGPFGGIGMGREIEEALALARSLADKDPAYPPPDGQRVLEASMLVFKWLRVQGRFSRFLRAYFLFLAEKVPGFRKKLLRPITGLERP